MDKEWSEKNKRVQTLLGKAATYKEGINLLIEFRKEMFEQITQIVNGYPDRGFLSDAFCKREWLSQQDACIFYLARLSN